MILVDTSIWIDYFRKGDVHLEKLLLDCEVVIHPFIIGELACGNLKNRTEILSLLNSLPMAPTVENHEILFFIERNRMMGMGIGLVDVHLLASAQLAHIPVWSRDKRFVNVSRLLNVSYTIA